MTVLKLCKLTDMVRDFFSNIQISQTKTSSMIYLLVISGAF